METATVVGKNYFSPLSRRYRDAYSVAASTVRFGKLVNLCSRVLGGVITIGALCASVRHSEYGGLQVTWFHLFIGLFVAAITLAVGYISERFLAAQGQFMSVMLDTAVNASPHLQDSEKASVMSL